jgi:hypothetical protein
MYSKNKNEGMMIAEFASTQTTNAVASGTFPQRATGIPPLNSAMGSMLNSTAVQNESMPREFSFYLYKAFIIYLSLINSNI